MEASWDRLPSAGLSGTLPVAARRVFAAPSFSHLLRSLSNHQMFGCCLLIILKVLGCPCCPLSSCLAVSQMLVRELLFRSLCCHSALVVCSLCLGMIPREECGSPHGVRCCLCSQAMSPNCSLPSCRHCLCCQLLLWLFSPLARPHFYGQACLCCFRALRFHAPCW